MRLILTEDDGTVLDSTEVTREELRQAQQNGFAAVLLLDALQAGDEPNEPRAGAS